MFMDSILRFFRSFRSFRSSFRPFLQLCLPTPLSTSAITATPSLRGPTMKMSMVGMRRYFVLPSVSNTMWHPFVQTVKPFPARAAITTLPKTPLVVAITMTTVTMMGMTPNKPPSRIPGIVPCVPDERN